MRRLKRMGLLQMNQHGMVGVCFSICDTYNLRHHDFNPRLCMDFAICFARVRAHRRPDMLPVRRELGWLPDCQRGHPRQARTITKGKLHTLHLNKRIENFANKFTYVSEIQRNLSVLNCLMMYVLRKRNASSSKNRHWYVHELMLYLPRIRTVISWISQHSWWPTGLATAQKKETIS